LERYFIMLPGMGSQLKFLSDNVEDAGSILIIGANTDFIAKRLKEKYNAKVFVIVDDNESLLRLRYLLKDDKDIPVRNMDYANTDFPGEKFDLVYSQASISTDRRNKIVKEVKRILIPGGLFIVGEITSLTEEPPPFVTDTWKISGITPLHHEKITSYYQEKFEVVAEKDLTHTLREFFLLAQKSFNREIDKLTEDEREFYKRLLKQVKHGANVYLKLGGESHIGFKTLLLRKK
jgi:SAM-dependent methyltransferase